jgi:hypothetical protein
MLSGSTATTPLALCLSPGVHSISKTAPFPCTPSPKERRNWVANTRQEGTLAGYILILHDDYRKVTFLNCLTGEVSVLVSQSLPSPCLLGDGKRLSLGSLGDISNKFVRGHYQQVSTHLFSGYVIPQ